MSIEHKNTTAGANLESAPPVRGANVLPHHPIANGEEPSESHECGENSGSIE